MKIIFLFTILVLCGCRKRENTLPETVLAIKETGQLITAEYTLSRIIKASDDKTWYKIGDRKILMSCEAYLKAGIDLQHIQETDFEAADSSITIKLPSAKIVTLSIPPDKIAVQYKEVDFFRDEFTAAEREALLAQAERQIRQLADSLGILKTAEQNAALYFQSLMKKSGFTTVSIRFKQL